MTAQDYQLAWVVYTIAGIILALLCWRVLQRYLWRELAYFIECILLALMFTPWFVMDDPTQRVMAPAIIVFALDTLMIDPKAGARALTPLAMALFVAVVVAILLSVIYRYRRHKQLAVVASDDEG